jgi:acyl-CoA synthetase (AMP-forming)/AMP-acid ligase II
MMYDEKTRGLVATPMYHKNAMVAVIKPLLSCGGSTVILNGFETETVLRVIDEHDITLLTGVPTMYQLLLDDTSMSQYDISSVTLARCGSDAVPETLMNRFKKKFGAPLLENYGITEGGPSALCTPRWGGPKKAGSAGIPYPNSQTLIIDPETGEELPPGKPGELLLANPGLGSYYNLPEIEDEAFEERDNRQFLHTEDIAYVDEDGYHYIVGRLDDMMVVGGENVYPAEVEGLLERHERVIESVTYEAAGCGKCVQHNRNPARCGFGRRLLECRGYRDSTAVRAS